ncbi:PspA/IM30 family protein [Flammeovirga yaeyamensis]|uniref:PspA/IM30 family protein n=1 Tax=Flammeovirga yaeyamensis TaxID=367791 RepID=A0AAX1NA98_9BACT|nr:MULTISPECIES: PspA/IM30 family protein [Flammeovirga]ANQ49341.1 PspA/IM30 family protein [Flammeovirga sp. MY04]MBB3697780.1 phage shock protein A [Flammeovirga yaeyamensis]NMF35864.1 PspA/IM30 family protein [Flammeovirga yaeyamensis]QWG03185.1 PspA/IM30 family protein [Flammeovirga yaeyamensis]
MFKWLKRLFGIVESETHSVLDKLENPIKQTEQGIRDLKADLSKSMQGLAEVKALNIREKKEYQSNIGNAKDFEKKAMMLLERANRGHIDPNEADRLATQALERKQQYEQRATANKTNLDNYGGMLTKMESNVHQLKSQISKWETELKTLKARATVSDASAKLNKQLSNVDSSNTIARLQKMKEKVEEKEALADSYADIASLTNKTVEDEIDSALGIGGGSTQASLGASDELLKLKARLAEKNKPNQ